MVDPHLKKGPQLVANSPWYYIDGINKNHGTNPWYCMYESYIKDRDSPLRSVVSYFVIEHYSIEGCPLEEASEHCFQLWIRKYILLFLILFCVLGCISSHIWYLGIFSQVKSITCLILVLSNFHFNFYMNHYFLHNNSD